MNQQQISREDVYSEMKQNIDCMNNFVQSILNRNCEQQEMCKPQEICELQIILDEMKQQTELYRVKFGL